MTSSSFQTIVGKSRDEIPGYGVDNYAKTEADLTDSVNEQINRNQQDTRDFYEQMAAIQKEIAERPLKLMGDIAQFSKSASQAVGVFRERQEAQAKIDDAMAYLDSNSSAKLRDAEGKLRLENAKFNNKLLNENSEESINFLRVRSASLPSGSTTRELLSKLHNNYYGARQQFINENGGQDITDIQEFIELHNAADELMITAMLMNAKQLGIDTNSREFRKLFYEKVYPDVVQRRENNIQSWKATANRNYKANVDKNLKEDIINTLQPYTPNKVGKLSIEINDLVEVIKNEKNFDSDREAVNYLFSTVATEIGQDQNRLDVHHLEYLFDGALFIPSYAKNTRVKYKDGKFKDIDANASLIQKIQTDKAIQNERSKRTNTSIAQGEIDYLDQEYKQGIPPAVLERKLLELEQRFPNINVRGLQVSPRGDTNGGEYPNAGKPQSLSKYRGLLLAAYKKQLGELYTGANEFDVDRAYGELGRRVENLVKGGTNESDAIEIAYKAIEPELLAGNFTGTEADKRRGKITTSTDIDNDSLVLENDTNKVRYQGNPVSLHEKRALAQYKRHLLYGEPFPEYFNRVTRRTKLSPRQYAYDRLSSTGGLTDEGLIKVRPKLDTETGLLIDTQYGLSLKDKNYLEVKPNLTKTYTTILDDPTGEKARGVLNGFIKKGNLPGTYQPAFGFQAKNGDTLTVGTILQFANRGASNFGLYGFSAEEVKDAVKAGEISLDAKFDENTQSQMVYALIRQRANRTNSARGAIIQAKKGGTQTVFEGDEGEKRWDRLINLKPEEINAILDVFPALRGTTMNQFQNLLPGIVLAIADGEFEQKSKQKKQKKINENMKKLEQTYGSLPG